MSKEAMKLALEALGEIEWSNNSQWQSDRAKVAINALREALANEALDKMAENARELGLDYEVEPKIGCVNHDCDKCKALAEQPAPVQDYDHTAAANVALRNAQDRSTAIAKTLVKRPQNCGTGYCSCIECVMEPARQEPDDKRVIELATRYGLDHSMIGALRNFADAYHGQSLSWQKIELSEDQLQRLTTKASFIPGLVTGTSSQPAQRTWVGLTLEDMETTHWSPDFRAGAKWADHKLKDKNNA